MSKIPTDKELADIAVRATTDDGIIDCSDQYARFLYDLGRVITDHFGGEPGVVTVPTDDLSEWTLGVSLNDSVPSDGGVYALYDTDVTWEDGVEL